MKNDAMTVFGIDRATLRLAGATYTSDEIVQQGELWSDVRSQIASERERLDHFLEPLLARSDLRIILTGAGSSAFIGDALAPNLGSLLGRRFESIATTNLVAGPTLQLQRGVPTLLVSFARSGNSPESVAAAALLDECVTEHWHLVVTCNREGSLYRHLDGRADSFVIALPERTHDRAFAMTSSFSSMLLAVALIFRAISGQPAGAVFSPERFMTLLMRTAVRARGLVALEADRVVFLGSNALQGIARESALKLLELTDGRTIAASDSSLGFRHGPKTIVNSRALVIMLLSNDSYTRKYDIDLLRELRSDQTALCVMAVTAQDDEVCLHPDHFLIEDMSDASDLELCLPMLLFAQVFALLRSLALSIHTDTPNPSGTVNRVVRGVTIHPLE